MRSLFLLAATTLFVHCSSSGATPEQDADLATPGDAAAEAGWATMSRVGLGPIQETGVAALDDKIYLVGGFNDSLQLSASVQVYDPSTDLWSSVASLPIAVHHANVASTGGKLYVLGAMILEGFNFKAIGNSYSYDPQTNTWLELSPMPEGTERGAAAMGVIAGKIYLAGGLRSGAVADVSSYDPSSNTWQLDLPSLPEPRDHLMGAAVGNSLYAIGGRSADIDSIDGSVYAFSPGDLSWQERAAMPTARGGAAAGVVNDRIIVVGGEGNSAEASGVFAKSESYDPISDSWTALPNMPVPRHGMGAAGIGGTLYVPGGATVQAFGAVDVAESFTP